MFTVDFGLLNMTDISVELMIRLSMKIEQEGQMMINTINMKK